MFFSRRVFLLSQFCLFQMSPGPVHGHGESLGSEKFWNNRDNLLLSPQYDWSHVAASTKIVVTCEDEPSHRPGEEEEDMDDNLENLCIAVTEQALN